MMMLFNPFNQLVFGVGEIELKRVVL